MVSYARAPITEAVVEFRFETSAPEAAVRQAAKGLKKKYVTAEDQSNVTFGLRPGGATFTSASFSGVKLTKDDQSEIAVISRNAFSRSVLPPYPGFDAFKASIVEDFGHCQSVYSGRKRVRIGMRFINRIDIPAEEATPILIEDYLKVFVQVPAMEHGPLFEQACRVVMPLPKEGVLCFINTTTPVSPLINHKSLALDIEVAQDEAVPQTSLALFERVDQLREYKNRIFEHCITDATRALFEDK